MLSRVADSLYWLSRYLERAEHISRLVDVHLNMLLDSEPGLLEQKRLMTLLESLMVSYEATDLDTNEWVRRLTFDTATSVSIMSSITEARENARQVREQISSEMWTQINTLYLQVRRANQNTIWEQSPHEFYKEIKNGSHLFQGITDATMNHHQGWRFIQLGRYIERTYGLLNLLNVHFKQTDLQHAPDMTNNRFFELLAVLKSVTAFEAYCKVYNPNLQVIQIIEFLLFDQAFPRSLRFCVDMSLDSLSALADSTNRVKNSPLLRAAGRLQSRLSYDEIADIQYLPDYLSGIKQQVDQIHDILYATYITYQIEDAL